MVDKTMRSIPAVHRFLSEPDIAAFESTLGRERVKESVGEALDAVRRARDDGVAGIPPFGELRAAVVERLRGAEFEMLVPVINGTGILLHTNLGRAPLAPAALEAVDRIGSGYSNLEYDLDQGFRSSRYSRVSAALQSLTGAQDALVVNNCAAAVLLILDTLARGREVVVARNQLIEIGGGFRLPEVLERSGAILVEVGTTNKIYRHDYARALRPQTALLFRSHQSNFRISGFTSDVAPADLVDLGRRAGIPVVEDLGSGALTDLGEYGLPRERTVQDAIADGIDLVAFSGDKLLGGPQAGIVVGTSVLVARLLNNPLLRALRVDKMTLAALAQTLRFHAQPAHRNEIPLFAMLAASQDDLRARAQRYSDAIAGCEVVESTACLGGGSLPENGVPSIAVAVLPAAGADDLAARLRRSRPPVVGRIEDDRLLLDLRTILPEQDTAAIETVASSVTVRTMSG